VFSPHLPVFQVVRLRAWHGVALRRMAECLRDGVQAFDERATSESQLTPIGHDSKPLAQIAAIDGNNLMQHVSQPTCGLVAIHKVYEICIQNVKARPALHISSAKQQLKQQDPSPSRCGQVSTGGSPGHLSTREKCMQLLGNESNFWLALAHAIGNMVRLYIQRSPPVRRCDDRSAEGAPAPSPPEQTMSPWSAAESPLTADAPTPRFNGERSDRPSRGVV
jgi:hypothetical protein